MTRMAQLKAYALECLLKHCRAGKPRLQKTADAYVARALSVEASTIEDIQETIRRLVDADDQVTTEMLQAHDWEQAARVGLLYLVKKYRRRQIAGRELEEIVNQAIIQLFDRGRHFPHYRGVSINAFLCETMRSIVDHELRKAAKQPPLSEYGEDRPPARR